MTLEERIADFLEGRLGTAEQERTRAEKAEARIAELELLLNAEKHNHAKDNEYLCGVIKKMLDYHRETYKTFVSGATPFRICKIIWKIHGELSTWLIVNTDFRVDIPTDNTSQDAR